jgi:prolyl oligopeptidase
MEDRYLWLEEIESEKSLEWVKTHSDKTLSYFQEDHYFGKVENFVLDYLQNPKKIAMPVVIHGEIHNLWTDEKNIRGLWRKCSIESYLKGDPKWKTVLDLDKLARDEDRNWVKRGLKMGTMISPNKKRMMMALSDGGTDAVVWREFCLESYRFLDTATAFVTRESKSGVDWLDDDTLLVTIDRGEGSVTKSGYPATVVKWRRGECIHDAEEVFRTDLDHMGVWAYRLSEEPGSPIIILDNVDFFHQEYHLYDNGAFRRVDLPDAISIIMYVKEQVCFYNKKDVQLGGETVIAGSYFSIPYSELFANKIENVSIIFTPSEKEIVNDWGSGKTSTGMIFTTLNEVKGCSYRADWNGESWSVEKLELPTDGDLMIIDVDDEHCFINYEGFLTPQSLHYYNTKEKDLRVVDTLESLFDGSKFKVEQKYCKSSDGTAIPYFLISSKEIKLDGKTPTILNGYGGFNISYSPYYLKDFGKMWLEEGGAFVVANIRGGGEFGPTWHHAALKENRQLAFDDFIAVAEDLVSSKVTSPDHLGILGGSNGGLLTSAFFTQRPDLINASCTAVPLIDMLRFHKLLAGHSWTAEYGNPDIPEERAYIEEYSPYQKISEEKKYPKVMLMTSTKDDRVHPGHARKMAAKMMDMGHEPYYYENTEGGHAGSSNSIQRARWVAIECTYFKKQLFDNK